MTRPAIIVCLALLSFRVQAKDVYHIHELSESQLTRTYERMLLDACRQADSLWHDSTTNAGAGYWGSGRSDQMNEGIRAISGMVLACGALLKHSQILTEADRRAYSEKLAKAVRYTVTTHRTGPQTCTDGKPWGASWQSALWTATVGFGAWLTWDQLDSDLRQGLERIIASEADRFLNTKPPAGAVGDTKAEENGWNMICLALAPNMFPEHPHAAAWRDKAIEYMINTLSVPADASDPTLVEGHQVSEWFSGANLHPDFTLENHGFFHPSYVACSSYFLTQAAMYFTFARRPVPSAATHHLLDTWKMLQTIILPGGESIFPQGIDWELHGLSFLNLYASLASYQKDPFAARMEQNCAQYMRAWQAMSQGSLAVPGSRLGFTRHAICCEQTAYAFLAHKIFGPPVKALTAAQTAATVNGLWEHNAPGFLIHRTENLLLSFSWKNRVMAQIIPLGPGHSGNPHVTVPIPNSLVGSLRLDPPHEISMKSIGASISTLHSYFQFDYGLFTQKIQLTCLGQSTVIYQNVLTAKSAVTVTRELGAPIGIENDQITGGKRIVYHENGHTTFDANHPQNLTTLPGSWANIDGRLGLVAVSGSGLRYQPATSYDPHMAVRADVLYGSFSDQPRHFNAGEEAARRAIVYFVEVSPKQTVRLAQAIKLEQTAAGKEIRLQLPEGREMRVRAL